MNRTSRLILVALPTAGACWVAIVAAEPKAGQSIGAPVERAFSMMDRVPATALEPLVLMPPKTARQPFGPGSFASSFEPPCFLGYVGGGGSGQPQNCDWHASNSAQPTFSQPGITNHLPNSGSQHLRFEFDFAQPSFPACNPDVLTNPGCVNWTFSDNITPPPSPGVVSLSLKLRISGPPDPNAAYIIQPQAPSQTLLTTVMVFGGNGDIMVGDDATPADGFFDLVNTAAIWNPGAYQPVSICVDANNNRIRYFYAGNLIWSTGAGEGGLGGGVFAGSIIEHVLIRNETNINDGVTVDVDDVLIEPDNCEGCPGPDSCCATHPTSGCSDAACCEAVCNAQPLCCTGAWTPSCLALVLGICGPGLCCAIPADCNDNNACTQDACGPGSTCSHSPEQAGVPCDADGTPCTTDQCDGAGVCVTVNQTDCQSACPLCQPVCDPQTGLCACASARQSGNWSDDLWNLPGTNPFPDNLNGVPNIGAVIEGGVNILLDVTVLIPRLCVLDDSTLRVTETTPLLPTGDITVFGPEGVFIRGNFFVGQRHVIDASAGPVVIGPGGIYRSETTKDPVSAALSAASLTLRKDPAGQQGGIMTLSDSMSASISGSVVLSDDKGSGEPPDLNVLDSAAMAVGGDFTIENAATIVYTSTEPMFLAGNFINHSIAPLIFDWDSGGLVMTGSGENQFSGPASQTIEAAGKDLGPYQAALIDNFAFGSLTLASGANVAVVDQFDNQDGLACEALYIVGMLTIEPGAVLDLSAGCNVYYGSLTNQGTIIDPGPPSLGQILTICQQAGLLASPSGVVNPSDLAILLGNWGNPGCNGSPSCSSDLNLDGAVNAEDLALLLGAWGNCT